jgi:hypothetical protein
MPKKLLVVLLLLCSTSHAVTNSNTAANSKPVGAAIVRGDMRIDGNPITSNATLFDGNTVETSEASATLQMNGNVEIVMTAGTRAVVHDGYVKLEQGKVDVKITCGYVIELNGMRITPSSSNSHAEIGSNASANVLNGEFLVLDSQGRVLNRIRKGGAQSFAAGQAKAPGPATYAGALSSEDLHPILTLFGPDSSVAYELQGRNVNKIQGRYVLINGTIDSKRSSFFTQEVISSTKETAMCTEGAGDKAILALAIPAAVGGAIAAAVVTSQHPTPASR